jgi:multiple sugar transport system permease protein
MDLRIGVDMANRNVYMKKSLNTLVFHVSIGLFGLLMIYPLLWLVASSFKPASEIWTRVNSLIPNAPTFVNYLNGWKGFGGFSFDIFYINSFIYSGFGTLFAILSSAIVSYGFARINFPGKKFWFACMISTLMLPAQIQVIPQYIMFSRIGWVNTFLPLLVPRLFGQAFFIFMLMQFIRGIPQDLDEAAEIDGCGRFYIFFRILLPLLKPAMFTASIFSFYWTWNDFLAPLIYLNNPRLYTLSLALRSFADPGGMTDWGAIFAMSFLSLVPVIVLFVSFQKYLTQGIATTGLKG